MEYMATASTATLRNWAKLNTKPEERLISRANKTQSKKKILPLEYFSDPQNISGIQAFLNEVAVSQKNISSVILSIGVNLLKQKNIFHKPHVQAVLRDYQHIAIIENLTTYAFPKNEKDLMGLLYQSLLQEGKKSNIGSYYTPQKIVENMTHSFLFSNEETLFDPCCGSGSFLLNVCARTPDQLFGMDSDPVAVMIAKLNLLLKYPTHHFAPQIYCADFLEKDTFFSQHPIFSKKFDYIATNPPWGATYHSEATVITSNETFSLFFVKAFEQLKKNGTIRFLFPEAILNVKAHKDIRTFISQSTCLVGITTYQDVFNKVLTKFVDIECKQAKPALCFYYHNGDSRTITLASVYETKNLVFNFLNEQDLTILQSVKKQGTNSLNKSTWALGIVTGNNKEKLLAHSTCDTQAIYTGKEITPYILKPANKYIVYNRAQLQQVAKDEIYRAPEKLVYKFISNKLVFSYDNNQSLFLNSANILIPNLPNMSIKTTLAFLNSELFQYLYMKLFGEVKILKGNLLELPFPDISAQDNEMLTEAIELLLNGSTEQHSSIQQKIYAFYHLSAEEISYIRSVIYG